MEGEMKKSVVYLVVLMALSVGAGIVVGMGIGRQAGYAKHTYVERFGPAGKEGGPREEPLQRALAVLNRSLGLSKEQTEKIENILEGSRASAETSKKEVMKNLETIKEKINIEIKAILTAEQQVKFERLMTERKQREAFGEPFGGRHHQHQGRGDYSGSIQEPISLEGAGPHFSVS